jgi:two-component system response regulator
VTSPDLVEILLVEDDAEEAELALDALRRGRVSSRIALARDGETALDFVLGPRGAPSRAASLRLILLDLKLPKIDGFGVLSALKADAAARVIPVVILTSSKMDEDVVRCYRLGANSYIVKPVDFDEFSGAVRRLSSYWLAVNRGV